MDKMRATISVLAAGTFWGCMSLFLVPLLAAGLTPAEIIFGRMTVAAVILAGFLALFKRDLLRVRVRDLWMFAVMGVVGVAVFNYLYTICLDEFGASVTVVLLNTTPIFTMILGVAVLHERFTARKVVALVLAFTGCTLVAGILGGHISFSPRALLIGLSGGFFYSFYSLAGRRASQIYPTPTVALYTFFFCALACFFLSDVPHAVSVLTTHTEALPWFAMIVVCTFLPYFTYTYGLRYLEASRAAILATIEVIVGNAIGIFVFGEPLSLQKLAGMSLVLAGIVLLNTGGNILKNPGGRDGSPR